MSAELKVNLTDQQIGEAYQAFQDQIHSPLKKLQDLAMLAGPLALSGMFIDWAAPGSLVKASQVIGEGIGLSKPELAQFTTSMAKRADLNRLIKRVDDYPSLSKLKGVDLPSLLRATMKSQEQRRSDMLHRAGGNHAQIHIGIDSERYVKWIEAVTREGYVLGSIFSHSGGNTRFLRGTIETVVTGISWHRLPSHEIDLVEEYLENKNRDFGHYS